MSQRPTCEMQIALYHNLPSGGAKRSLYETVRRLSNRHTIHSFTPSSANQDFCDYSEYSATNTVIPFKLTNRIRSPFGRLNNAILLLDLMRLFRLEHALAQQIDSLDYDVVIVHPSQWTQAPSLIRRLRTPVVYYCHEPLRRLYEPQFQKKALSNSWPVLVSHVDPLPKIVDKFVGRNDRLATQSASCVATNSHFTASEIRSIYGVEAVVAYHGVDTEVFHPLTLEREPFVLSVGALLPHKGFDFVIRSLALIPKERRLPLIIVSNTTSLDEKQRLQTIASAHEVEVTFRARIGVSELVRLYNTCRLLVYAPHNEPFGLVPLEAMACGAPVVSVREAGPSESVVSNETGILVDRNEEAFARAIISLLQNSPLRERLGRQAHRYVRRFWTWDRATRRLENILNRVAYEGPHVTDLVC